MAEAAALFARDLLADAGPTHTVWLVWSPDYATFQGKCNGLLNDLGALRSGRILFYENPRSVLRARGAGGVPGELIGTSRPSEHRAWHH